MSSIKAFLQPPVMENVEEVIVSKRFVDDDGKPVPFKVRAISQEINSLLMAKHTKKKKQDGQIFNELDNTKYMAALVVACTVEPDFKNAELCAYYKTANPEDVPLRMLSTGEFARLSRKIREVNGMMDEEELEEAEEEAKNS